MCWKDSAGLECVDCNRSVVGFDNGPFAAGDHMVQKPPYWTANCALGDIKQRKLKFSCFVLDVPVRNLISSMAVFVPCDHQQQRAHSVVKLQPDRDKE